MHEIRKAKQTDHVIRGQLYWKITEEDADFENVCIAVNVHPA